MIERLTAVVEAQTQRFNRSMDRVNDMMRRMADTHTVEVEAEIASFQARVRQAEQQIDNFIHRHQRTRVDLDADSDDVQRAVSAARTELASLPNRVTTNINGDTSDLTRAVATAQTETRSLPNRVWIFIEARTDRFENSMNRLAKITNSVSTVIGHSLAGAFTSALPAISPVLASITGAIGSLGPMLGVAAGGVMGLGSAFAVAGTGAASFGALAVSSLSGVFKASEDLKKLQEKLDETTDAKERAKIMEKIKAIQQSLGKEEKKALDTLEDFKANWQSIAQSVQKPILKTFTSSLTTFKGVLNSLRPMFKSVANGGVTLAKSMNAAFKDTDMRRFIDYMNKNAGQAFVTFGKIAGNVLRTVMNLIVAFGPLGNDMSASLEKATASWVKWSANLGSSEKFQTFIEYVKTNGPKLLQIIGNLSGGLTKLFTGFAPMSQDMMTSLVNMTKRFNEWAGSVTKTKEFQSFIDYIKTNGPTVWSTIGEIAKTIINLLVGMAPLGQTILQTVNSFLKFTNAAMQANPAIGQFIAVGISLVGALRAIVPAMVAVSAVTNGLKDFRDAAQYLRTFKDTAAGIKLAGLVTQLKTAILEVGRFIARYTAAAAASTANAVKMAASWTAMKISALVSSLKSGIVQMGLWIKNMTVMAAQSIAQATRTATAWTIMKISSFVTSLRAGIVQMGLWIKQMVVMAAQSVAQAARMAAAWTAAQISSFASMLAAGIKQMIAFGARLVVLAAQAAANAARMAASWVIAMGPIGWITAAVVGLVVLIIANWDKIKAYTIKVWGVVSKWLSSAWTGIKNAASKVWSALVTLIKANFELQRKIVMTVWNAVKSFSSKVWNGIKNTLSNIWNGLKNAASTAFLYMKNQIANRILATREKILSVWNAIKSKVSAIWNALKSAASNAFLYMKNQIANRILATREKILSTWNAIKSKVQSIWNGIKSAASNAFLYMKNQIANRIIATREKIVSIWNSVMKFFKGINLKSIGRNIIQGLINGISGMAGALASKIKSMANAIPNGMKKLLGIHSPSRVMRDQVGYHVGTGMAAGIDKSQTKVKSAAASAAKVAQRAAAVEVNNKVSSTMISFEAQNTAVDTYSKMLQTIEKKTTLQSFDIGNTVSTNIAAGIQYGINAVQNAISTIGDAMYIEQKDMNLAYDTSISKSDLGVVRKELSADVKNLELPERTIVIEMDSKKVGQGVEKPVTDAQRRSNARRVRIN
ncbi:tail tape measure protein [Bacillus spizizenii]|nr:tail tape measure protein [Bacillus spizizenii]